MNTELKHFYSFLFLDWILPLNYLMRGYDIRTSVWLFVAIYINCMISCLVLNNVLTHQVCGITTKFPNFQQYENSYSICNFLILYLSSSDVVVKTDFSILFWTISLDYESHLFWIIYKFSICISKLYVSSLLRWAQYLKYLTTISIAYAVWCIKRVVRHLEYVVGMWKSLQHLCICKRPWRINLWQFDIDFLTYFLTSKSEDQKCKSK